MKDEIILDCDDFILKKRKEKLLSELDEIDVDEPAVMISDFKPKKEKKMMSEDERLEEETNQDDWLATVANFKVEPVKRKRRAPADIFNYYDKGKKKKKKKNKEGLTDFNKEFEHEMNLIKDLMVDQSKFTDSLQKKYDAMESTKSSARGIGKFTTDLIEAINSGRQLSLQLIKEQAGLKKTIADLSMKEKKEFGQKMGEDGEDIGLASSSMLRKMISEQANNMQASDIEVSDADNLDELFESLSADIGETEDSAEIDKYLKYENANVTLYACINEDTDTQYFVAKDENGNVIDDYPLPEMTKLNINRSTNVATDIYSRKYPIIWLQ